MKAKTSALQASLMGRWPALASPTIRGYLYAVLGTASLAVTYVVSKVVMREINSESFNAIWFGSGALITLAVLATQGRASEMRVERRNWGHVALLGLVNGVSMGLFFKAVELIDPVLVSFYFRLEIVASVLAAVFLLGERLGARELGGMILAVAGAVIITYASGSVVTTAFVMVAVSAVLYSLSWLVARATMQRGCPPTALAGLRSAGTAIILALYVAASDRWLAPSLPTLALIVGGSFFGPFLANSLNYRAIPLIGVARLSIIRNIQPLFVLPAAYLVLGSIPGWRQLAGGLVVVAGVILVVSARTKSPASPAG
ncbi:MAG: DMT family transporter [Chloroflexi bacterium]|nr:DMT family transporter [Chloroflexota bacterium]